MLLIRPKVFLQNISHNSPLDSIAEYGHVFCKFLLKQGHESVFEHVSITARIICDRGVSHELVRHRRYCNYSKHGGITFILPPWIDIAPGEYHDGVFPDALQYTPDYGNGTLRWFTACQDAERRYLELLALGWRAEMARAVLPNSLKTEVVMTCNLREWRHFFSLRCAAQSHPQMREVANMLLEQFREAIPVLFDSFIPVPAIKEQEVSE